MKRSALKSRHLLCNSCNEQLGGEIDHPTAEALDQIRHLLRVRSGDGADPPTLRKVESEHGLIDMGPDRITFSKSPPLKRPAPTGDGRLEYTVNARTMDDAALQTAHAARMAGFTSREQLAKNIQVPATFTVNKLKFTKPVNLRMGLPEQGDQHQLAHGSHPTPAGAARSARSPMRGFESPSSHKTQSPSDSKQLRTEAVTDRRRPQSFWTSKGFG